MHKKQNIECLILHIVLPKPKVLAKNVKLLVFYVTFKALDEAAIRRYMELVHVYDKAGAYAIQEHGDMIIEHFEGDLDNVIGLPVTRLLQVLRW